MLIYSSDNPVFLGGWRPDMRLRIGVLSDTHLHHLTKEFRDICNRFLSSVDLILHAGDFVSPEVVAFLGKKDFHAVHGNMDPVELKATLPEKKVIQLGPHKIGLIHGWGSSAGLEERIRSEFQDVDVIVYGHSHRAVNQKRDGVLLFNPGTVTGFTISGYHSIGMLEIDDTVHGEIIDIE